MLSTCQVVQCEKSHCNLKNGFMDLCQAPRKIREEATAKIEHDREQKQTVPQTIKKIVDKGGINEKHIYTHYLTIFTPIDRENVQFDTTPKQRPELNPDIAFARISRLRTAKTAKASKQTTRQKMIAEFMEKQGFKPVIIEPEPRPEKWIPERENAYERNIIRGMTDIEDRCVYRPVEDDDDNPVFIPDVTKKEQYERDHWKQDAKLLYNEKTRQAKIEDMLNMGV